MTDHARESIGDFNVRCLDCGHVGNRVFARGDDGELRDVMGGGNGITPAHTQCACGSRRYEMVPARCHRLLVGQGGDTWDPLCSLPDGHEGTCRP
jgi:hypothetical protein